MKIANMFKSDINRNINGVIKVMQTDEESIEQELREYIITKELKKHFDTFINNYLESFHKPTDKIGVWISGFFGSGKSHFLKILSYLLSNDVIGDKHAIEYFEDKFDDPLMFAQLEKCVKVPTDTILFNIDAKSENKNDRDAILKVFAKVFYDSLGFYGTDIKIVRLEQFLTKNGQYEAFKEKFKEINGESWEDERASYAFLGDDVVSALVNTTGMSETAAWNWIDSEGDSSLSVEDLAKDIKEHVDSQPENYRLLFMVDEIGQYIGDSGPLMLNLQTIVEELGSTCMGQVWVVVTSQEAIDKVTKISGDDFSKIQGRFNTRLSLSSSSVDEVIKKRILAKNEEGEETLSLTYGVNSAILRNLYSFKDAVLDIKGYGSEQEYIETFPFVPYQFKLMQSVLTEIRQHGNSGKHLSEGERSMLSGFQEVGQRIQDKDQNALVPFSYFYDTIETALEGSIRRVINRAQDAVDNNEGLEEYDVDILKLLYLIRYVDDIPSTIENISVLMVDDVNIDVVTQKEEIKKSLERLLKENYIARSGDRYNFLTDDEQDISKEISNTQVDSSRITRAIGDIIFGEIFTKKKIDIDRELFDFEEYIDGNLRQSAINGVKLKIITDMSDDYGKSRQHFIMESDGRQDLLVVLSDEYKYYDEILQAEKIKTYARSKQMSDMSDHVKSIINDRRREANNLLKNSKTLLEDAIKDAKFYALGDQILTKGSDASEKIYDGMVYLIKGVYEKHDLIEKKIESDDEILEILKEDIEHQISVGLDQYNKEALEEIMRIIDIRHDQNRPLNMDEIQKHFQAIPYGWREMDIAALIAQLLVDEKIQLKYKGNILSRDNKDLPQLLRKNNLRQGLVIEKRIPISEKYINQVRDIVKEYLDLMDVPNQEDKLVGFIREKFTRNLEKYKAIKNNYNINSFYPGKEIVEDGEELLRKILSNSKDTIVLFEKITSHEDDLLDLMEDFEDVEHFFDRQKDVFDEGFNTFKKFNKSVEKNYLSDSKEAIDILEEMKDILYLEHPYRRISELPGLIQDINTIHGSLLEEKREEIKGKLEAAEKEILINIGEGKENLKKNAREDLAKFEKSINYSELISDLDAIEIQIRNTIDRYNNELARLAKEINNKKIKNIDKSKLLKSKTLKTDEDIDNYSKEINKKLKDLLKDNDELRIW